MRKLNLIGMMTIAMGVMLLVPGVASSNSEFHFDGGGYSYVFFAGSEEGMLIDNNLYVDSAYGETHPVLDIIADYYVGAIRANYLTVETLVMVYDTTSYNTMNGADELPVEFTLTCSDGQGQDGKIRSSLSTGGLGILWGSGFYTALLAEAPFSISQYVERSNPLTYGGLNIESPSTEGLGYSVMWAQLYENWYSSSYTIFEYLPAPIPPYVGEGDSQAGGYLQLTGTEGLDVDILSSSTAPITYIEEFYYSQVPKT